MLGGAALTMKTSLLWHLYSCERILLSTTSSITNNYFCECNYIFARICASWYGLQWIQCSRNGNSLRWNVLISLQHINVINSLSRSIAVTWTVLQAWNRSRARRCIPANGGLSKQKPALSPVTALGATSQKRVDDTFILTKTKNNNGARMWTRLDDTAASRATTDCAFEE